MEDLKTLDEVRKIGIDALCRALGPVDMARFLQQFDRGQGDYTRDREQWLGHLTVDQILAEIDELRNKSAE